MKISFNDSQKMFAYMTGIAAALALFIHYVSAPQSESILIICITLAIIAAGIWLGSIYALAGTIIVLFVLGTLMMFLHTDASSETELQTLVIWGIALLLFSFMSGRIHDIAIGLHRSVKHLQDEINSFVAIDRVTGFDNKQRMKLELSEEIKRAERYGNSFVFLLLQMHYFKEFKSLYGEKETDRLFQFVSSLRQAFGETPDSTLLYLRLEDISPMSDEKLLLQAGAYLHKRNIPFILSVIPVYVNPETGDKVYMSEKPKLVNVLRKLQDMGGSVIVHGYTHTYRYSETGEGFEFWDAKADQPITSQNAKEPATLLQKEQNFPNEEAYQNYLKPFRKNEETYTRQKLTNAIEDLTAEGLYPLAFEAPHYTMSEHGYQIASQYFTSLFGQVQLSDTTWKTSGAGPFVTKPAILHGMTLYPETIGYVDQSDQNPLGKVEERISQMIDFEGGVAGAFYHPYLGMKYLPELVDQMERIPNSEWLDIKKTKQTVKTDKVEIHTSGDGTIQVKSKVSAIETFFDHHQQSPLEKALWILSLIVLLFVVMFVSYTLYLRATLKKRIFKERKNLG
ncbi:DUF2334 domain-containing protein [Bacillus paralicheniformis]|nr:DUF2334 domain-containing protein [Bacillus paralicheniformis]